PATMLNRADDLTVGKDEPPVGGLAGILGDDDLLPRERLRPADSPKLQTDTFEDGGGQLRGQLLVAAKGVDSGHLSLSGCDGPQTQDRALVLGDVANGEYCGVAGLHPVIDEHAPVDREAGCRR